MIAIDSNVLVRLLVNDDEAQGSRARAPLRGGDIWIGKTVLLETFWLLRSVYDLDDMAIVRAIEGALGLPGVQAETLSESSWSSRPLQTVLTSPTPCTLRRRPAMLAPSQPSIEVSHAAAKSDWRPGGDLTVAAVSRSAGIMMGGTCGRREAAKPRFRGNLYSLQFY